jgi:hypothetical protein
VSAVIKRRRTLGEIAFNLALDGAIKTLLATIDTVRFVRKMRRRIEARRKR